MLYLSRQKSIRKSIPVITSIPSREAPKPWLLTKYLWFTPVLPKHSLRTAKLSHSVTIRFAVASQSVDPVFSNVNIAKQNEIWDASKDAVKQLAWKPEETNLMWRCLAF